MHIAPMNNTSLTSKWTCSYVCRYSPWSVRGSFTVEAATYEEAVKAARAYLMKTGGVEGLGYDVYKQ